MSSLKSSLMDAISRYREPIGDADEDELEQAFADVEKDLRHRGWLGDPVQAKGLGREAAIIANWLGWAHGLLDDLQEKVVARDREGSLAQIDRIREMLERTTI